MKRITFCLLLVLLGCGGGDEGNTVAENPCCKDHGGTAGCMEIIGYTHGYFELETRVACNEKSADGSRYFCTDTCTK